MNKNVEQPSPPHFRPIWSCSSKPLRAGISLEAPRS
jgi:hypothetical protein